MEDHTVNICDSWNGNKGNKVTFQNPNATVCNICQIPNTPGPSRKRLPSQFLVVLRQTPEQRRLT